MKKNSEQHDISKKVGFDISEFKKAAQNGNVDDFLSKNLSPDAASKIKNVLSNKEEAEKLLSSPQAKELMKKFGKDK